jgi:cytosine deaminase
MRLENYGLDVGCNADFTLLTGETLAHAVVDIAPRPLVVKNGRVTARNGVAVVEMP